MDAFPKEHHSALIWHNAKKWIHSMEYIESDAGKL